VVYPREQPGEEWPEIVTERVAIEPVKPLDAEIADFVACVRERREPFVSGEVGVEALEVALAVKKRILSRR
jgi:predicted dehydrogenase